MNINHLASLMETTAPHMSRVCNGKIAMTMNFLLRFQEVIGEEFDLLYWSVYFGHIPQEFISFCRKHPEKALKVMRDAVIKQPKHP